MSRAIISPWSIADGRVDVRIRTRGMGYVMIKSISFCYELRSGEEFTNHQSMPAVLHMHFRNISCETDLYDTKVGSSLQASHYPPSSLSQHWDYTTLLIPTYSCHTSANQNGEKNILDGVFWGHNVKNHMMYQQDTLPTELHITIQVEDVSGTPVTRMPMLEIDFEC